MLVVITVMDGMEFLCCVLCFSSNTIVRSQRGITDYPIPDWTHKMTFSSWFAGGAKGRRPWAPYCEDLPRFRMSGWAPPFFQTLTSGRRSIVFYRKYGGGTVLRSCTKHCKIRYRYYVALHTSIRSIKGRVLILAISSKYETYVIPCIHTVLYNATCTQSSIRMAERSWSMRGWGHAMSHSFGICPFVSCGMRLVSHHHTTFCFIHPNTDSVIHFQYNSEIPNWVPCSSACACTILETLSVRTKFRVVHSAPLRPKSCDDSIATLAWTNLRSLVGIVRSGRESRRTG